MYPVGHLYPNSKSGRHSLVTVQAFCLKEAGRTYSMQATSTAFEQSKCDSSSVSVNYRIKHPEDLGGRDLL